MFAKRGLDNRPVIMGYDIAGVVEKTGASIKKFKTGDAIYRHRRDSHPRHLAQ
jgi:NADPH:quinone reductase-like Zn-dependent oxidoreductase